MAKYIILTFSVFLLVFLLLIGCSDRGTNDLEPNTTVGGINPKHHVFNELFSQIRSHGGLIEMALYIPDTTFGIPNYPFLVLLAPQEGDEYYYFNHGLKQIADELIATKQIEPMVIVCIPSNVVFGGYFFAGDHPGAGNWDDLLGISLVDNFLMDQYGSILTDDSSKMGISGFGQGAYGAFRTCLLHPEVFTSISAVDGPLDFDGATGNGGLIPLMDSVFVEQSGLTDDATFLDQFDSLLCYPLSRMFIGGSYAFSPHDLGSGGTIADEVTLIDHIVIGSGDENLDFHLPFSFTQRPYTTIWDMWVNNNLENLMTGTELQGKDIWIGTSPEARYGFHDMTMSWVAKLQENGYTPEVYEYIGYNGYPATGSQYVYNLLKEILIFHSDSFNK